MARPYNQWERRLVAEWVAKEFPAQSVSFNVRLGDLPPVLGLDQYTGPARGALLGALRRFADAVVWAEHENVLIEGKMRAAPDVVGQLLLYARELATSPDALGNLQLPTRLVLLCAVADPAVTALCADHAIECHVYTPEWTQEWMAREDARGRPVWVRSS